MADSTLNEWVNRINISTHNGEHQAPNTAHENENGNEPKKMKMWKKWH